MILVPEGDRVEVVTMSIDIPLSTNITLTVDSSDGTATGQYSIDCC